MACRWGPAGQLRDRGEQVGVGGERFLHVLAVELMHKVEDGRGVVQGIVSRRAVVVRLAGRERIEESLQPGLGNILMGDGLSHRFPLFPGRISTSIGTQAVLRLDEVLFVRVADDRPRLRDRAGIRPLVRIVATRRHIETNRLPTVRPEPWSTSAASGCVPSMRFMLTTAWTSPVNGLRVMPWTV